jgi:hypothetical protein
MDKLKVLVCSDLDYENLIAEIYAGDKFIGLISQEDGIGNFMVEFHTKLEPIPVDWLLDAIQTAKRDLIGNCPTNQT